MTARGRTMPEAPLGAAAETMIRDYLAAAALHQVERVRHFIEIEGLHPDSTYRGKPTALCYAVLRPHRNLMGYLLERGADVNRADVCGMTPLHYATMGGCLHCVSFLIGRGARLNDASEDGRTPLALALERPKLAPCRELLLRYGASLQRGEAAAPRFH